MVDPSPYWIEKVPVFLVLVEKEVEVECLFELKMVHVQVKEGTQRYDV